MFKGTITVVRTIESVGDAYNWNDKITIEGIPTKDLDILVDCDLIDLNENLWDHIGTMEDD